MRIAIVEDNVQIADTMKNYIKRYEETEGIPCTVSSFLNADLFLFNYKAGYDCVFLDIDLPGMSGLDGARKLRKIDKSIIIIFSTAFANYAVDGYSVNAADYLVKPYSYEALSMSLNRVRKRMDRGLTSAIIVKNLDGTVRIPVVSILYVEQSRHRLLYHTDEGVIDVWGTMPMAEEKLKQFNGFERCGAGYLVNLRYVKAIEDDFAVVGHERIKISRAKKKQFIAALNIFIVNGGS